MKRTLLLFGLFTGHLCFAQVTPTMQQQVFNDVGFYTSSDLVLFQNTKQNYAGFEVPYGSGVRSIFASSPWFTASDGNGKFYAAANTFGNNGGDFAEGLMSADPCYFDAGIFSFTRSEIEAHRLYFNTPGYKTPKKIATYPASKAGNQDNAPFVDVNSNGAYEPNLGDYPDLPGDYMKVLFNHDDKIHGTTGGDALKIEVITILYGYKPNGISELANTVFVRYLVTNRSALNYADFSWTQWSDFDLGNSNDDYVGTHVGKNLIYVYNGDSDDNVTGGTASGYGQLPPACGLVFLSEDLDNSIYYDLLTGTGPGQIPKDYYNYARYTYPGGAKQLHPSTNTPYRYVCPGNSDPSNKGFETTPGTTVSLWDEISAQNPPGDRRILGSTASKSLNAGETRCFTGAFVWARTTVGANPPDDYSVQALFDATDVIQQFYNAQTNNCK